MKKRTKLRKKDGFALIITIMLLSMLTLLAVGMLTLGAITLRSGSVAENKRTANANARMALMLALGELQRTLGNDNRVTANASLLKQGADTNQAGDRMLGVWEASNPYGDTTIAAGSQTPPTYDQATNDQIFKGWLVSSPETKTTKTIDYGKNGGATDGEVLFSQKLDGFEVRGQSVEVTDQENVTKGSFAWGVVQEADKAKINVGGDADRTLGNDAVQAPSRPSLEIGKVLKQPKDGWVERNNKVISMSQSSLDTGYGLAKGAQVTLGPDYTASSQGVMADVVKNRLKTDLSLAFELPDASFKQATWGDTKNPFMQGSTASGNETPLFLPVSGADGQPVGLQYNYGAVNYTETFPIGAPPTFNTLRSFYRTYASLYDSNGSPTAYERPQNSYYWQKVQAPTTRGTETGIGPVLDRMIYIFGLTVVGNQPAIVITPVITLWNPYNVGIDSPGYVAYPFIDLPMSVTFNRSGSSAVGWGKYMSQMVGLDFYNNGNDGRQQAPYFYCQITSDGTSNPSKPIHLDPGEVRIFVCADAATTIFQRSWAKDLKSDPKRVIRMKPVEGANDLTYRGGLVYAANQCLNDSTGMSPALAPSDSLGASIRFDINSYNYGVALEDNTRIKNNYQNRLEKNQRFYNEVHVLLNTTTNQSVLTSPNRSVATLTKPVIFGSVDTYHRTATASNGTKPGEFKETQPADLVYTTNIRQRFIHPNLGPTTTFTNGTGPHYETHMVTGSTFDSVGFQASGNDSYYGETNAPPLGQTHLAFFEVPREPMLSLGAFQHADLTDVVSSSANQFGNSWASPYVDRSQVAKSYRRNMLSQSYSATLGVYDTSYLANSALWDGYYFSSLAPRTTRKSNSTPTAAVYDNVQVQTSPGGSMDKIIDAWLSDPQANPLRNPRYLLHKGDAKDEDLKAAFMAPKGCRDISAHLLVDGPFNVNSTSKVAWKAMLASLRGESFSYEGFAGNGTYNAKTATAFPRLRYPIGPSLQSGGNRWTSFRELSDDDIDTLAEKIVEEVKSRGPFLSMSEFVNRRLVGGADDKGFNGAIQAAINNTSLNQAAKISTFVTTPWNTYKSNIRINDIGVGLPFWLTQADILTEMGPFLTVRSDTFTIRAYGEARDKDNKVLARSWCEATVQRMPEFIDPNDAATVELADRQEKVNQTFGRKFDIVAFRWISPDEINNTATASTP